MELRVYKMFELTATEEDVYTIQGDCKKEYKVGREGNWTITKDLNEVAETIKTEKERFLKINKQYEEIKVIKDEITEFCAQLKEVEKDGKISRSTYYIKAVEVSIPVEVSVNTEE